jgi:uncharacterized cupredoxin-like copper-binding protein
MKRRPLITSILLGLMFLLAACSGAGPLPAPIVTPAPDGMEGGHDADGAGFGVPGDPASIDRSVDVRLLDSLAFDPSALTIPAGETIEFRVTNAGATDHELVLGDEATQQEHESAMGGGGSMSMDEPNLLALGPGETGTLVWTFTEPGTVLYGCHTSGHYPAGMAGTITVTAAQVP